MASKSTGLLGWAATALGCAATVAVAGPAGAAHADDLSPAPLPVFAPHPSDWQPNSTVFPYNLWQSRVTPEQLTAEREACQWFNAQYGPLMGQVFGFQHYLAGRGDDWSAPGVQGAGNTVKANLDQSAAFLDPARAPSSSSTTRTRASNRRCTTATRSTTCGTSSPRSATRSIRRWCPG